MSHKIFQGTPSQSYTYISRALQTIHDSTIRVEKNALSSFRGICNALGTLEDNRLKNNHTLVVPLPSTYAVKFYRQNPHKYLPNFPWRCVIALGWQTNKFFPPRLPLTIFRYSYIQVFSWILVHPILLDAIQHVFGFKYTDVWVVSLSLLKSCVPGLDAWEWRRRIWGHRGVFQGRVRWRWLRKDF